MFGHRLLDRARLVLLFGTASVSAAAAVVACGTSDERLGYEEPVDGSPPDASESSANLPDTSPPPDGGPPRVIDASDEPVTCAVTPCATELAAGQAHFCARMSDGTARCWGDDEWGSLGAGDLDGGAGPESGPVVVAGLTGVTQVSAAGKTSCARLDDGTIWCWGINDWGQLGLSAANPQPDWDPHRSAAPVDLPSAASRVDVGVLTSCARLESGAVHCWGKNDRQQLGPDGIYWIGGPNAVDVGGLDVTRTGVGGTTVFAMTKDGRLATWGTVSGREGSIDPDPTPLPIPTLSGVTGFSADATHACAISEGRVMCWGRASSKALCIGIPDGANVPTATSIAGPAYPQRISVAAQSTCARLSDGTIQCCGNDTRGQLGQGTSGTLLLTFTPAKAFTKRAVQVVTSETTTCALVDDGSVECWGGNAKGELGQGTRDEDSHPTPVRVVF